MTTTATDWPDLAGRLTDFGHALGIRVYFEDTDFSGMVYHASYLRFMERGRSDFLRLAGVSHEALARGEFAGTPMAFAVARMAIDFRRPGRIDDILAVETRVGEVSGAIVKLEQAVKRGHEVLVTADVSVVLVGASGKPQRIPKDVGEWLSLKKTE